MYLIKTEQELYDLEINETGVMFENPNHSVLRVPGGWLYTIESWENPRFEHKLLYANTTFVAEK